VPLEGLLTAPAGDARLFIVEQQGRIRIVRNGQLLARPFLDIASRASSGGERGLLSVAFHPRYAQNGYLYVNYTDNNGDTRVERYRVSADPDSVDPASDTLVLAVDQPYSNHNGGHILFGPDGMLYVAMGDGGSGGDPQGYGQSLATLLGKLLRIDVDGGAPYAVPPDNPFAGARDGSRGEIWAYGLRNPWRFSFDRATGALWLADVGQDEVEEVDRIVRGGNYGWNVMEGTHCYQPASGCARGGLELPVSEYSHAQGRSITGGFVYRGGAIPALRGRYLFADYASGTIWSIPAEAPGFHAPEPLLESGLFISSFGEDAAGELYVLDHGGGRVFRLVPAP